MKINKSLLLASILMVTVWGNANANSVVTYLPVSLAHGARVVYSLMKGTPTGMQSGTTYTLTCQTTANEDAILSFEAYPATWVAKWSSVTVNGKSVSNQFLLPANGTLVMSGIRFNFDGGAFIMHNLDNTSDVTFRCTGVPVF